MVTTKNSDEISSRVILAIVFVAVVLTTSASALVPEKVLKSFNGTNGNQPFGFSMDRAGNLWVTTGSGGTGNCKDSVPVTGCGVVVELTPSSSGWDVRPIYSFQGGSDGWGPVGPLAFDAAGNVYGVTESGGLDYCYYGCGTVFELTPQPSGRYKESVIYRFNSANELPMGGVVIDAAGNLFGTTYYGGDEGLGTVFEVSPTASGGWTERIVHSFTGTPHADGALPYYAALVFDGEGNLYGTASAGGTGDCGGPEPGCGVVFELSPTSGRAWTENILYNFQGGTDDGDGPLSGLAFDAAGNLYGTTQTGGLPICQGSYDCGVVFKLSPAGGGAWKETVIHKFSNDDGQNPVSGLVVGPTGNLYGVTPLGGVYGWGTAFELTPGFGGVWTESFLHNFGNGEDGAAPITPLIFGSDGNLYGATVLGGPDVTGACNGVTPPPGCGTVFELAP